MKKIYNEKQVKVKEEVKDPYLENIRHIMESRLNTAVEVSKHKLVISYNSTEDLNRILEKIGCLDD